MWFTSADLGAAPLPNGREEEAPSKPAAALDTTGSIGTGTGAVATKLGDENNRGEEEEGTGC